MIWAIGDLHFDPIGDKPMDIFGDNWIDHKNRIISNWKEKIHDDDLVLLPGDISWAMRLDDAITDLKTIDNLPGQKAILRGNHDYWWSTMNKLNSLELKTITFIYNTHFIYKDYIIIGTRGWDPRDSQDFDEKDETIFLRELNRLRLSYDSIDKDELGDKKIITMVHYPPFNSDGTPNEFLKTARELGSSLLVYGHIHGPGLRHVKEGEYLGVDTLCVSSDYLDFNPKNILE